MISTELAQKIVDVVIVDIDVSKNENEPIDSTLLFIVTDVICSLIPYHGRCFSLSS